ncbi:hypothetical protein [Aeoliella sp.]|uniref:hypothetical protein n=1 Tax=Aeoliella sp. TaxID=2795800 RepID=UPI003CCC0D3B
MNLEEYSDIGLKLLCPSILRIKERTPNLYAESQGGSSTMVLLLDPPGAVWREWRNLVRAPLGKNPMLETTILRQGEVNLPYDGYEIVTQQRVIATGDQSFGWAMVLSPRDKRVVWTIEDDGEFKTKKEMWTEVVRSLRVE